MTVKPSGFGNRTPEQIEAALEAAHQARRDRAAFMQRVKSGEVTLEDVLIGKEADNEVARQVYVRTLLRALPGIGPAKVNRCVNKMGIIEGRRVRGLGVHQRLQLLGWYDLQVKADSE